MAILLKETIQIFKSSDEKNIKEAMVRGLHNDMYNIFSKINKEIEALPPQKRKIIRSEYLKLLSEESKGEFHP